MATKHISYLRPLFLFFISGLFIMTLSRIVLFFLYQDRVTQVDDWWQIFTLGLRLDVILMSYLSFIPALLITIAPKKESKIITAIMTVYCSLFLLLIFITELTTPEFIDQYDTRPNKIYLEYLIYPKEIFNMLLKARFFSFIIITLLVGISIFVLTKTAPKLFKLKSTSYSSRLLLFPVLAFLLFWGARGSLTAHRPINASNSVFSNDQLVNVLGVNSFYTVAYAAYSMRHETSPARLYGNMEKEEAYNRVKKYMNVDVNSFTSTESPFLHRIDSDTILERPYNLVIFLQESLGAEYVGVLGGKPLTPNLDAISKEGLLFTNLYCTGTRSVRGIEAVVTGFPPSPSESVVKLGNSQQGFFTIADFLKTKGYNTSFIYGGMANFDNMASFFSGNGFSHILDESYFDKEPIESYAQKGVWGYSDEDLVRKANDYFKSLGDEPFFSLMFSTSNHEPFEFPDNRIELYEEPKNTVHNAMKYADYAIGEFFRLAQHEEYYKNTLFVVIADHNTRTQGQALVPINKFHIPALIIGPNIEKGSVYNKLASQIDIPSTVLSMLGVSGDIPTLGRNLITLPDSVPGRAIMQFYDTNAFRVENKVIIMQPKKDPLQFDLKSDVELIATEIEEEFAKDALGHVMATHYLYKDRAYKLLITTDDEKQKQAKER